MSLVFRPHQITPDHTGSEKRREERGAPCAAYNLGHLLGKFKYCVGLEVIFGQKVGDVYIYTKLNR